MDTGTLIDMFRAERDACLLGTDAVRDGIDVPGDSLRLIVLERVPWGTPTILERARREAFGGAAYTDMVVRLRLRQAFGRLIRRDGDRGSFVILDPRLASRFCTAFPPGISIRRVGLVDAIDLVRELGIPRAYFTHISHQLGFHAEVSRELPEGMELAYDGLEITI